MNFTCARSVMLLGFSDGFLIPYDLIYDVLEGLLILPRGSTTSILEKTDPHDSADHERFELALSLMPCQWLIRSVSLCGSTTRLCIATNHLVLPRSELPTEAPRRFLEPTSVVCRAHHTVSIPGIDSYLLYVAEHRTWDQHVIETMRMYDGVLLMIDCEDRHNPEVEDNILRVTSDAYNQGIRVRIFFDNMLFFLTQPDNSDDVHSKCASVYHWMCQLLDRINNILVGTTSTSTLMMDVPCVEPISGTVLFGSSVEGWAFTLMDVATNYASKYHVAPEKLLPRLWGDSWFLNHKWYTRDNLQDVEMDESKTRDSVTFITLCMMPMASATCEKRVTHFPANVILQRFLFDVFPDPVCAAETFGRGDTFVEPGPKMEKSHHILCDPTHSVVMVCPDVVSQSCRQYPPYRVLSGFVSTGTPLFRVDNRFYMIVPGMRYMFENRLVRMPEDVVLPCGNFVWFPGAGASSVRSMHHGWALVSRDASTTWDGTLKPVPKKSRVFDYPTIASTIPDTHDLDLSSIGHMMPTQITDGNDEDGFKISTHTLYEHRQVIAELKAYVGPSNCNVFHTMQPVSSLYYESVGSNTDGPICMTKSPNKHNRFYVCASALTPTETAVLDKLLGHQPT
eukprot:PhF_6_TR29441/c0_g1_i3/m.43620/K03234/EEF2; elongation factor 2